MKSLTSQLMGVKNSRGKRQNMSMLALFLVFLFGLILIWSILFHIIMSWEGQEHTWITGMYWTLTVMSTLGFGDITFTTDIGRIFSICVLLSGTLFMLILLPVTFIEFFYQPWIEAQVAARAPTALPEDESGHVILVSHGIVNAELIRRLEPYHYSYALLVSDLRRSRRPGNLDPASC
jgi:hypothetical protein